MMTKRDFYKDNERKAYEIAERQHERTESRYNMQAIASEANLILHEWWCDYQEEHV